MYRKAPGHVTAALQDGIMYKQIYYSQRQPAHHPHQELASRGGPVQQEQLADPVPLQQDPASAQSAIKGNPLTAHWDFNKIAKTVFMMEFVTTAEALAIIKPR